MRRLQWDVSGRCSSQNKKERKKRGESSRAKREAGWKCHRSNRSLHKLNEEESGRRLGGTQHLKMLTRELEIAWEKHRGKQAAHRNTQHFKQTNEYPEWLAVLLSPQKTSITHPVRVGLQHSSPRCIQLLVDRSRSGRRLLPTQPLESLIAADTETEDLCTAGLITASTVIRTNSMVQRGCLSILRQKVSFSPHMGVKMVKEEPRGTWYVQLCYSLASHWQPLTAPEEWQADR